MRAVSNDITFSDLAWQSRKLIWGGGLSLLGLALLGIIAFDCLKGSPYSDSARFLTKEASIVLLVGAILFSSGVRQVRWWVRLWHDGQEAAATITKVKLSRMQLYVSPRVYLYLKRPRVATYVVHYRYQDQLGNAHDGRSGYLVNSGERLWQVGDRVQILYDLAHPEKSMWIG
jgi:hypothetical protein